jgi:hypothetical protein
VVLVRVSEGWGVAWGVPDLEVTAFEVFEEFDGPAPSVLRVFNSFVELALAVFAVSVSGIIVYVRCFFVG